MALREILVELGIDVDDENAEKVIDNIKRGLRRMGDDADKSSKKTRKGLRGVLSDLSGIQKAAIAAGAAFLTGKLAQGLFSVVETASDAAEITNKLGAVFKDQTPAATEFGTALADRIGQSRIQIQEMTADVGALVKPLVGSEEAALGMAKSVTELSFDIASFENVKPEEALIAFRSALIGSSEPMLRFGVDTRQAALAQFALDKGMKKSIKSMSAAEVTALRLELIQKRLGEKGAVGDATKTANGFANRMRALQGAFRDLKAVIGEQFLPVANDLLGDLVKFVRAIGPDLAKAARVAAVVFKGLLAIFTAAIRIVKGLSEALTGTHGVLFGLSAAVLALGVAFKTAGVSATVAGLKAAASWVIATAPVLLMIALLGIIIGTIALVIEDLIGMGEGADSVSGTIIQGFMDLVDELGSIPAAIAEMLETALQYWLEFFGMTNAEANEFVSNLSETLKNFWANVIEYWSGLFGEFIGGITKAFGKVSGFFSSLFGGKEPTIGVAGGQGGAEEARSQAAAAAGNLRSIAQPGTNIAGISPTAVSAPGAGASSFVNQPKTDIKVDVNASGANATAEDIAGAVSREINSALERRDRQTIRAFSAQGA